MRIVRYCQGLKMLIGEQVPWHTPTVPATWYRGKKFLVTISSGLDWTQNKVYVSKNLVLGTVAHACDPSYLGGGGIEDQDLRPF
jgi:hypothetical protein